MKVPFNDLSRQNNPLFRKYQKKLKQIFADSDFVLGKSVKKFEKEFSSYLGVKYCIGVASGTDALLLSLLAHGIGKGDEVIVPAFTFTATISPVLLSGATVKLVDIEKKSPNIDPLLIEKAITKRTKVIVAVHLYGIVCDMDLLKTIAKKHKLLLIEDACQAHGSIYKNKLAGTLGDIGYFSFYPGKNLGGIGDGGIVVTDDKVIAENIMMLRNHGQLNKYEHKLVGINSRLDSLQAAMLTLKLPSLDLWNKRRSQIADSYRSGLSDLPVRLFSTRKGVLENSHLFAIRVKDRDKLMQHLSKNGIGCGIHYPTPIHFMPAFKYLGYKKGDFPNSEELAAECLSLPIFPEMKHDEVSYVIKHIRSFFAR